MLHRLILLVRCIFSPLRNRNSEVVHVNQKAIACLRNIAIAFITQSKVLKLCHKQQQL
ncbi:hypothetical protein [Nostoc favosum]|uniref:Transposase n=1 Tax=Nostoc favosum CHAB5714 TaxID=2780399 RepID=A0ABS8IGK6_9NOSO|nr:hypothetical protein [Nostoc favosum]MCC5603380.1 hypothetical protein [Nostoc favosum CHAB5714]